MNLQNTPVNPFPSRFSLPRIKAQLLRIRLTVRISLFLCLGGVGITTLVAVLMHASFSRLVRDPAEVFHFPAYIGMLSNWGVMLWTATAAICLFSAKVLDRQNTDPGTWKFIRASGWLSLYLGLDDLFRLHDKILPGILHFPEAWFYVLYLMIMISYTAYYLPQILEQEFLLLAMAVILFGLSRWDIIPFFDAPLPFGAILKYFGIVFWLAFFYRVAASQFSKSPTSE